MPHAHCCDPPLTPSAVASAPPPIQRPRGLWRARATPAPPPVSHAPDNFRKHPFHDLLSDDDDASSDASSRKRPRLPSTTPPTDDDEVRYWDYSRKCSPHPERLDKWSTRMDTTSTAIPPADEQQGSTSCDLEDWEDLKELFARAAEIYENQPPPEAMPLLRGVIHECHRFMRMYYDPSIVYAPPVPAEAGQHPDQTPPEQRLIRDWLAERPPLYPPQAAEKETLALARARAGTEKEEKKCKCKDLPTAFYTILGTTLFFFGNIIDQDPAQAASGEADVPTPYWLAALDVFEIGENLPIRTSGRGCPGAPEDWRMAIIWGRTLVCLAHEALAREKNGNAPLAARAPPPETVDPASDPFIGIAATFSFRLPQAGVMQRIGGVDDIDEEEGTPKWPPGSPFALIHERRLPRTGRLSLANTSADEMMLIAKDQFSRGIFHMPHPLHHVRRGARAASPRVKALPAIFTSTPPLTAYLAAGAVGSAAVVEAEVEDDAPAAGLLPGETFSRAKELFTIASEVLDVAERFPAPAARAGLAGFADGVLSQMKLEANSERAAVYGAWARAGAIVLARGRANLVVGTAKAEEIEERIEKGDDTVWDADEAIDGREALGVAIVYLEKAREALLASRADEAGDAIIVEPAEVEEEDGDSDFDEMDESPSDEEGAVAGSGAVAPGGEGEETTVEEVGTMLAEALLTLANLTRNAKEREALYTRAQREGGDAIVLDEWEDDEDGMEE